MTLTNAPAITPANAAEQFPAVLATLQDAGKILPVIAGRGAKAEQVGAEILRLIGENDKQRAALREELQLLAGGTGTVTESEIALRKEELEHLTESRRLLDVRANTYLVNCANAFKEVEAQRSPITQMLTVLSSAFIEPGKKMNIAEKGSCPARVQLARNAWAKECQEVERKKQEEAERIVKKKTEAGQLAARFEEGLRLRLSTYLANLKQAAWQRFDGITLDTYATASASVENMATTVSAERIEQLKLAPVMPAVYHNPGEVDAIKREVETAFNWTAWQETAHATLTDLRTELLDKLPAKLDRLNEIKKAQAESAEKAEQLRRQQEEEENLRKLRALEEQEAAERRIREQGDAKKSEAVLAASFEMAAVVPTNQGPKTKEPLKLRILDARGWGLLLNFWLTKEAKHLATLTQDELLDLGKKGLSTLVTYALKAANDKKAPEQIESPYLEYYRDTVAKTEKPAAV